MGNDSASVLPSLFDLVYIPVFCGNVSSAVRTSFVFYPLSLSHCPHRRSKDKTELQLELYIDLAVKSTSSQYVL